MPIENFLNSLYSFLLLCIVTYSRKDKLIKDVVLRQKLDYLFAVPRIRIAKASECSNSPEVFPVQLSLNFEWILYF